MGYAVDANFESEYEEGLLFTAHQILAELGEKVMGIPISLVFSRKLK
jgi:hypothetical protein